MNMAHVMVERNHSYCVRSHTYKAIITETQKTRSGDPISEENSKCNAKTASGSLKM